MCRVAGGAQQAVNISGHRAECLAGPRQRDILARCASSSASSQSYWVEPMLWRLYQFSIFSAVMWSDYQYGWGHDGPQHVITLIAIFAAWIATAIPIAAADLFWRGKALLFRAYDRIEQRGLPRV